MSGRLKRAAVIGDLTGYGRCALAVSLPVLSSMKIQACPLPTAVISAIPYHDSHFYLDLSDGLSDYTGHWLEIGIDFDGILAGFMCSRKEMRIISDYLKKSKPALTVVDPVMGDDGHLYSMIKDDCLPAMRELVKLGDVCVPNLTEACALTNTAYSKEMTDAGLDKLLERMAKLTKGAVIIKSVNLEGLAESVNVLYENGLATYWAYTPKPERYHGCGDLFASVLTGRLILGDGMEKAFITAGEMTSKAVSITWERQAPPGEGILFEEIL